MLPNLVGERGESGGRKRREERRKIMREEKGGEEDGEEGERGKRNKPIVVAVCGSCRRRNCKVREKNMR